MAGTTAGQKAIEGLAGDISLGLDEDGTFQYMPTERTQLRTFEDLHIVETLDSIDKSLKTLLDYMEEMLGDKFG